MRLLYSTTCLLGMLLMQGCIFTNTPKKLTTNYSASNQLNIDRNARPSPLVISVYQLKSSTSFKSADFFSLYDSSNVILGDELISKEQIQIRPEQKLTTIQELSPKTQYIAIAAAYHDINNMQWRRILPLSQANKNIALTIDLGSRSIEAKLK